MDLAIQVKKAGLATRFLFLISGLAISSWAPMVPYAKDRLNLNEADLGLVLFEFGMGALLIMPATGCLVHKFGSRNISLAASSLLIALLPCLTLAPSPVALGLILFLFGMSIGAANVAINSHAVAVEALAGRPLMSGFHSLFSIGGLAGASLISMMLEMDFLLFTSACAISAIIAVILFFQSGYLLPSHFDIKATKVSFSWPGFKILFLGLLCFIMFLAEGAMLDWSAVFLTESLHYAESIAGVGYALFSVAMAVGRATGDKMTQRFGSLRLIQLGSLAAAIGLWMALNAHWYHCELIGFFLIGIGASNIVPLLFSMAGRLPDSSSSYSLTIITTFGYTGILLGPALIGFVAQLTSLSLALTCIIPLLVFVGISARVSTQTVSDGDGVNQT